VCNLPLEKVLLHKNTKNELKSSKDSIDNVKNEAKEKLDLQREIRDKEIDLMEDGIEKEQALIQEKYKREKEDLIANSKDKIVDAEQLADAEYLIDENLKKELADLTKKYDEEARKKRLEEAEFIKKNKEDIAEQERQNNIKIAQEELAFEDKQTKAKLASLEGKEKEEYEKRLAFQKELDDLNQLKLDGAFASQEDYEKAVDNLKKKYADKDTKRQEEIQKFAEKTAAYFKKKSEEKVKEIDNEISAAEKQADVLKTLADNGNINAQQSLAEQQRIINEANLRKQKELRKQMRMEQGLALFKLLGENADKKNALGETIKDATGLMAFINSLPMFYDGTEDTGSGGGVDGKGGFHAILHPHERVIPKSLNDQIGNLTNEQLTRLAMEYQNGRLIGQDVAHSSMELAILATKLDNLTEVIKHKPETNIALGQITQSAMEIVESRRTGNTVIYNRFKVRK